MTSYYNDIDPYCCQVLRKNITRGNLPGGTVDERDIRNVTAADLVEYNHIHLFAGIGGFPLGLKWANFPESIKILTGGFPCQDISVAGKRAGITGSRSGLWSEMYRLVCDLRPDFVIVENVAALLYGGIDRVLADLAACGYDAEWQVLSAEAIGAPHLRERVFIVGYPMRVGCGRQRLQHDPGTLFGERSQDVSTMANSNSPKWGQITKGRDDFNGDDTRRQKASSGFTALHTHGRDGQMADPDRQGLAVGQVFGNDARTQLAALKRSCSTGTGQWAIEPPVGRLAHGVSHRVEQLRGYGNSLIPQLAAYVALCIMASLEWESEAAI